MSKQDRPVAYQIGDLSLDLVHRQIRRDGREIACGRLTFDLLAQLAEAAPDVVSREELCDQLWGGRYVSPGTLKQRVALLRQALGDHADEPRYIKVVRGQGYALIPAVEPWLPRTPGLARWQRFGIAAVALLLVFWVGAEIGYRDGLEPRGPRLDNAMSVVVTSWPMPADDENAASLALPEEDYPFVMGLANRVVDALNAADIVGRLNAAQRAVPGVPDGASMADDALTFIINATVNETGTVMVSFFVLNAALSDDRLAWVRQQEWWSRTSRSLLRQAVQDLDLGFQPTVLRMRLGRNDLLTPLLTASFSYERAAVVDGPADIQEAAAESIVSDLDQQLALGAGRIMFPL